MAPDQARHPGGERGEEELLLGVGVVIIPVQDHLVDPREHLRHELAPEEGALVQGLRHHRDAVPVQQLPEASIARDTPGPEVVLQIMQLRLDAIVEPLQERLDAVPDHDVAGGQQDHVVVRHAELGQQPDVADMGVEHVRPPRRQVLGVDDHRRPRAQPRQQPGGLGIGRDLPVEVQVDVDDDDGVREERDDVLDLVGNDVEPFMHRERDGNLHVVTQIPWPQAPPPHPSIFNAARNAVCGISTRPNWRIRFLPSFCLSSSLRLRLMSPP